MRPSSSDHAESDAIEGLPHPRDTERLFGHAEAEQGLLDAYRTRRLSHAWLIGGPRGIGKATLAWRFTRFLLANPDPDGAAVQAASDLSVPRSHPVWARLQSGGFADVAVLRREWNDKTKKIFSEIRVDDVREALQLFQRASAAGGYRICIIDSADDLNRSSANALLKVIEEPPARSLFLIVAHQPTQVMPTILSRCRKMILTGLSPDDVHGAVLATGQVGDAPAADLDAVIGRSHGSVSQTIRMLSGARLGLDRDLRQELDRLPEVDWRALHRLADRLAAAEAAEPSGIMLETVLDWLDTRVRTHAMAATPARRLAPLAEVWEKVRAAAREAEALNLDKRPLLLSIFADLAQATRMAGLS
ncbi:DNA polymerase III subunit delta' [Lichenihabitans psoromatis]|uniref:DNA polymerase III subunit delta' n=1 Tax=Lichenihabitans psoromatis TaxID=2528642 RepID=UPI001035FEDF|nr:DNA polymerase III subunit delta' [Lichenihabitans psoromatis]